MTLQPEILNLAKADWHNAPRGTKSAVVRRWAGTTGVSYQTMYRALSIGRERKADKGVRKIEGIEEIAMTVAMVKKCPPEHKGEICTEDAINISVDNGLIPEEMKHKKATIDRIIRENGLTKRQRRVQRYQADRPNQMHHVDASSSECFYVEKVLDDGDCILKLHKGHPIYKNKPIPTRFRPWIYGLADDHSGLHVARYVAAIGESAIDNLDFLQWAWAKNPDKPFFGIPDRIKGDLGPMMRGPEAKEFFERWGIEIDGSNPENKESHGKIERPWRTMWSRFEMPFFVEDMKTFEITLSELNRRFLNYQAEYYNSRPHRFERRMTRLQAWQRINSFGGALPLPENAIHSVAKRLVRTVDAAGVIYIDNEPYEVVGLHSAKVDVLIGVFDEKVVVRDQATGEKYETKRFTPNSLGEFTQPKDSQHIKAVKAAKQLKNEVGLTNTLYVEARKDEKVVHFPTRVRAADAPENPLEIGDTYRSLEEAMRDFCALSGVFLEINSEERIGVESLILEGALSKTYVRELAMEVQAENERMVANG